MNTPSKTMKNSISFKLKLSPVRIFSCVHSFIQQKREQISTSTCMQFTFVESPPGLEELSKFLPCLIWLVQSRVLSLNSLMSNEKRPFKRKLNLFFFFLLHWVRGTPKNSLTSFQNNRSQQTLKQIKFENAKLFRNEHFK